MRMTRLSGNLIIERGNSKYKVALAECWIYSLFESETLVEDALWDRKLMITKNMTTP